MPNTAEEPSPDGALPYLPQNTGMCTDAFYRFIIEYRKIFDLFWQVLETAARIDKFQAIAAHALAEPAERVKGIDEFNKKKTLQQVQKLSEQLSRNLVTGMVNNFHCYVSELLQEVMSKRPEILRSSERVTTEEILQFNKMADIRAFLADRKVSELSYGGLWQMQEFLRDRLGVKMFRAVEQEQLLTIFVELRNIHTHNRGIVNRLFLNRTHLARHGEFDFKLVS